ADGEGGGAAQRLVYGYPDVVHTDLGAHALGQQVAGSRAERLRGSADHVAFASLHLRPWLAGDEVGQRIGLLHHRVGEHREDGSLRGAGDQQADFLALVDGGVWIEFAHRADVESRIVDWRAGKQQLAALDVQVLAVGPVGAVHSDLALA